MTDTANGTAPLPATRPRIAQSYEMMFPRATNNSTHPAADDTSHGATPVGEEVSESSPPRWSSAKAFLLGWLMPSTTAQRTQDLSLRRAWLIHFAAAIIAPVVISLCVICGDFYDPFTLDDIATQCIVRLAEVRDEFRQYPYATTLAMLGIVALIEVGHAALALLMMAWGARDEPLRESYRNAIRQVWIRTAHLIPMVVVFAAVDVPLSRMDRDFNAGYTVAEPEWPVLPANAAPGSKAMTEYNKELREYWPIRNAWQEQRNSVKPWYLVASPFLIGLTVFCGITWILWAMLRSVGAPRRVAPIARPPTCENCGYNLLTIPEQSVCPECARPVLASIGADVRPGPIWQDRRAVGGISAWVRCVVGPVLRPTEFGMQCRLGSERADHRRFFVLHLPPIFLTALVAFISMFVLTVEDPDEFRQMMMIVVPVSPVIGFVCGMGTLGVTLAGSTIVGLFHSHREKRNLLPGAMQVASYLGGFLMLWAMFGANLILGVTAMGQAGIFASLQDRWAINPIMAMQSCVMVPNVAIGIWYLVLLSRGTVATRYANK